MLCLHLCFVEERWDWLRELNSNTVGKVNITMFTTNNAWHDAHMSMQINHSDFDLYYNYNDAL